MTSGVWLAAAGRRRRSTSPIAPTRSISAASTTSGGTSRRWPICTSRRSKRSRSRSTPRIRPRSRTSAASRSMPPASRAALGMSDTEIQGVKTAALLHDIGKLAVPEHILSKPGPLTQEEFQKIRVHPQVGAEIISAVPFPYPVAPLILSHHERWDGKGYPQGLKAEEIPLGARILSVVDYFDALTSDRPYHKAMTPRRGARAAAAGSRPRARSRRWCRCSSRWRPELAAAAEHHRNRDAAPPVARTDQRARPSRGRLPAGNDQDQHGVRRHRARASRNLRALRNRADDGHQPRRRRHDGADLVEAVEPGAVLGVRAVPLRRRSRHAALPLRDRRRSRRDRHA